MIGAGPALQPTVVGAPLLDLFDPPADTGPGRFHTWLATHQVRMEALLTRLMDRWRPQGCFIEVNFEHPDSGPAGAIVLTAGGFDVSSSPQRVKRVMAIPMAELTPYIHRWERGETVLLEVAAMPEPLVRRYAALPVVWSLNVPVHLEREWVGLIGATADETGFTREAVASFEAAAGMVMGEMAADLAWKEFRGTVDESTRLKLVEG